MLRRLFVDSLHKIPRYQILTTEGILERGEQAIVPENWLIAPEKGVGKAVSSQTETLFDSIATSARINDPDEDING